MSNLLVRNPNIYYGGARKRKRKVVRRSGRGFFDKIKSGLNWLKNKKVISTVANALAPSIPAAAKVASVSSALGYGRVYHKRTYRKRKVGGRKRKFVRRRGRGMG